MKKLYLENIIDEIRYENMDEWKIPNIKKFSLNKTLFNYQIKAIENLAKTVYLYYGTSGNGKEIIYDRMLKLNAKFNNMEIKKYDRPIDIERDFENKRYNEFLEYYKPRFISKNSIICPSNFLNRAAFWMATGSGKSLVLIKSIEYIDYLQTKKLIPKKDIMLLLPKQDLISQLKKEIKSYNIDKVRKISLINIRDYEKEKNSNTLFNEIKIYYYRSDLIRSERKESFIDYKDYDNNGNWYIFLDEAHIGETGQSNMQDYVTILSRNGFLFNFSATFTDELDYYTTCYNFNLEKFIQQGYGKNIYLCDSSFEFSNKKDEFSETEKQKQILKSLITYSMIKDSKQGDLYHDPLMITLVNSVNTKDSDLMMFFKKIEEIAINKIDNELLAVAKQELIKDFENKRYVYGIEELEVKNNIIKSIRVKDILINIFNSDTHGRIEIIEGLAGKELVLKLETSDKPFALIRIGDTSKFKREKLGKNYLITEKYEDREYFKEINQRSEINMLLGSRSFYQGWDSNRPNIINFVNIGRRDAQKYVLQALGRGIRIEPYKDERKRLDYNNPNKNMLLETLFVFATDKKAVQDILKTIENEKTSNSVHNVELEVNKNKRLKLLIPKYKAIKDRSELAYFNLSRKSLDKLKKYFHSYSKNLFLLKYDINMTRYNDLLAYLDNESIFVENKDKKFKDIDTLMESVIRHVSTKSKEVKELNELKDEINHYKYIKLIDLKENEIINFKNKVKQVSDYKEIDKRDIARKFANDLIKEDEYDYLINQSRKLKFEENVNILKLAQHYYMPIIYSDKENLDTFTNIIKVVSEVRFIENLTKYIENKTFNFNWMFSKISESRDSVYIPYYNDSSNLYSKFYPDFIFWIKKENDYKIIFIDPKGTTQSDYTNKVDEFEKLFKNDDKSSKIFKYEKYNVVFELKLVGKDINSTPRKYREYWLQEGDFSFLDI